MGFSIDYGSGGIIGGLIVLLLVGFGAIVVTYIIATAKRARDEVVEEEGDDPDLIA